MSDWKDRFLKFETLHGIYMVPLGIVGLYVTFTHIQYIFQVIGTLIFMYAIIEGCRLIGYNPIKKAADIVEKREKYLNPPVTKQPDANPPSQ